LGLHIASFAIAVLLNSNLIYRTALLIQGGAIVLFVAAAARSPEAFQKMAFEL
jgi:hypothetical protein